MIFLPMEIHWWTPYILPFMGVILGYGIVALIVAGIVAAAATSYGVKAATEGHWPWEHPGDYFLGLLKASSGGLGSIVSDIQGQPTLVEQLARAQAGTSRGGGTAGYLQAASGQMTKRAIDIARQQTPEQIAQGGGRTTRGALELGPKIGGGVSRFQGVENKGPTPSEIRSNAWKDIGIGVGTQIGSIALGGGISSLLGPATSATTSAVAEGATSGAASGAPAVPSALCGIIGESVPQGVGSTIGSTVSQALNAVRAVPSYLSSTATGVLQQGLGETGGTIASDILQGGLYGAGKGAITAAFQGQDPGRAALTGLAGGGVSGGISGAISPYMPQPEAHFGSTAAPSQPYSLLADRAPSTISHTLLNAPDQPGFSIANMQTPPPTISQMAMGALPGTAGGLASSLVNQAMMPAPPRMPDPVYQHRRPYWEMV